MNAATVQHPTGLDLKLARTACQISQTALAQALGVSPQAISNLEARLRPTSTAAARYLAALEQLAQA